MSADDEALESEEKKSYGLWGRVILFLVIVGPGSVIAFGLWVRAGLGASVNAGASRGDWSLGLVGVLWIVGLIGSAIAIFKK